MKEKTPVGVTENIWASLRRYTDARIGLGRAGISLPTAQHLDFQLSHARARDAVQLPLDVPRLREQLRATGLESVRLHSAADSRTCYLQRPDLGRRLNGDSAAGLKALAAERGAVDACIVVADGLSSFAVQQHGAEMTQRIHQALSERGLTLAPICLVEQGRVAVGDEVGELLGARLLILLVGERPGLSSPDSLGIYFTYAPRVGLTDASRNCISNIRPAGLPLADACDRLMWLVDEAEKRGLSGVQLKDESGDADALAGEGQRNFLLE